MFLSSILDSSKQEQGSFGWPDDLVNLKVDILPTLEAKQRAFACHQTQFGGDNLFSKLPAAELRELMRYEYLALARPEPAADLMLLDLFES